MPHTYQIGIKALIKNRKTNKVLFLKNADEYGKTIWGLPGGRMEKDEQIEKTLERELKEEIPNLKNYEVKKILSANPRAFDRKDGHGLFLLVILVLTNLEKPELSEEHDSYIWLEQKTFDKQVPIKIKDGVIDNKNYVKATKKAFQPC